MVSRKNDCRCIFATHYHGLAERLADRSEVQCAFMQVHAKDDGGVVPDVTFLYKLTPGIMTSSYGPSVAALAGVPAEVLARIPKEA